MANEALSQLPPASGLNGNDLFLISQATGIVAPWISRTVTSQQLRNFCASAGTPFSNVTMRQLKQAMVTLGIILTVSNTVSADISNSYNIAWFSGTQMSPSDPFVTGFLQAAPLSYSDVYIAALFALAATYPA